ncbi:MAG TPA: hypothetical protein VD998_01780 [Verrucomicrobiae bacterium]|nr:hypothetical protein [Verrucomicrobiae bacterium]
MFVNKKAKIILGALAVMGLMVYMQKSNSDELHSNLEKTEATDQQQDEIRQLFKKDISNNSQLAYENFKQDYANNSSRHTLAHVFGEELYVSEGYNGVAVCDDTFEFGCYHGFFSAGLSSGDMNEIYKFDEACKSKWGEKFLPCQHGIGHGILSQGMDLNEALEWCKKITWHPTGGCTSGVFMEYNFPTLTDHSGTAPRKLSGDNYYSPCDKVSVDFVNGCYFELPQWWLSVVNRDFGKMGQLCNDVESGNGRQWCFYGIGNYAAANSNFNISSTITICDSIDVKDGQNWCRESAAWLYLPKANQAENVKALCGKIPECLQRLKLNPYFDEKQN